MSKRYASIGTYIVLIILGVSGFLAMNHMPEPEVGLFPKIVCSAMVILSVLGILDMFRHEDVKLHFGDGLKYSAGVVVLTLVYLFLWRITGAFFILTGVYAFLMFWLLMLDHKDWKKLLKIGLPVSIGTVLFIWVIFYKIMYIRF